MSAIIITIVLLVICCLVLSSSGGIGYYLWSQRCIINYIDCMHNCNIVEKFFIPPGAHVSDHNIHIQNLKVNGIFEIKTIIPPNAMLPKGILTELSVDMDNSVIKDLKIMARNPRSTCGTFCSKCTVKSSDCNSSCEETYDNLGSYSIPTGMNSKKKNHTITTLDTEGKIIVKSNGMIQLPVGAEVKIVVNTVSKQVLVETVK